MFSLDIQPLPSPQKTCQILLILVLIRIFTLMKTIAENYMYILMRWKTGEQDLQNVIIEGLLPTIKPPFSAKICCFSP